MTMSKCLPSQLPKLMCGELDPVDADHIMEHLEQCASCQVELDSLSADESWWQRAKLNFVDSKIDEKGFLVVPETPHCSIDTALKMETDAPRYSSTNSILNLLDPAQHPELLGRLDEFDIEEKIGQGGMGIVFRGFDRSLNRPVAIKVMAPHLSGNDIARQRFEREAKAAAAVVHPSVVPIYRVSTANKDRPYIAMALADGLSLQEYVTRHGPLDVKDVVRIGVQIASGLAEAHKHGVIHRDVKPANVLFEKDVSRILITDFGLARAADEVMMTQSGCLAGTPSYMSPEQVIGNEIDARSDLFSLGSLLYFISTGREPFRAESAFAVINKVTRETPKSARSINIDMPEVLNRIIERLMEKDPVHRIESAARLEQLLTQLSANLQEPSQHELPVVKSTLLERKRLRRRIGWAAALAGIFLLGGLAWNGLFSPAPIKPTDEYEGSGHEGHRSSEHDSNHSESESKKNYEHDHKHN